MSLSPRVSLISCDEHCTRPDRLFFTQARSFTDAQRFHCAQGGDSSVEDAMVPSAIEATLVAEPPKESLRGNANRSARADFGDLEVGEGNTPRATRRKAIVTIEYRASCQWLSCGAWLHRRSGCREARRVTHRALTPALKAELLFRVQSQGIVRYCYFEVLNFLLSYTRYTRGTNPTLALGGQPVLPISSLSDRSRLPI